MKTIAEQLNVKDFPFRIKDKNGNTIYCELSDGCTYKYEYDSEGRERYFQSSEGYWEKSEYDSDGNQIYYEDSDGVTIDNRPKETIKSTWSIRDCFKELRMSKKNHLGFGDIKLTIAQQEEICDLVESLIEKRKTTEQ